MFPHVVAQWFVGKQLLHEFGDFGDFLGVPRGADAPLKPLRGAMGVRGTPRRPLVEFEA